jgi:hypothetical protein
MARGEFVEPKAGRVIRAKVNAKSEPELTFFHSYFLFEPGATVPTWLLWPAWEFWCRKMGQARLLESISTASQLSRALNEKVGGWTGAQGPRPHGGSRRYSGIRLRDDADPELLAALKDYAHFEGKQW